ncbi:biogenesis of lysosome-related organelles complex 1 subunit 5 [Magallana gigas]|uniref:biogenesis of lysosome-related organelles complex 1 subunit 5 n=1 Tax=Magallana gigas TaxID=29159 RepID=UPI003341F276
MDQQLFRDLNEIHARLFDHRPILQGHINYFVREFEEKRNDHEIERLKKLNEDIRDMKDELLPQSTKGMDLFLANLTAKLKVATEVCNKVEKKENSMDTEFLEKERVQRKDEWIEFLGQQAKTCEEIDEEFTEQAGILARHYADLEKNLKAVNSSVP